MTINNKINYKVKSLKHKTGKILLILAGLTFVFHTVIPHSHHYESDIFHTLGSEQNNKILFNNPNNDLHCHSLNILENDISRSKVKIKNLTTVAVLCNLNCFFKHKTTNILNYTHLSEQTLGFYIYVTPTRGSPFNS